MKNLYLKAILFCFCLLASINAFAETVEIDGIIYNIVSKLKTAEVTKNPTKYIGTINIPETVFYNNITYNVTSIGEYAFESCTSITSVTIPNSVTSIGRSAFAGCSLTFVIIPNSVTTIGNGAFAGCSLDSITIGNNVTSIGERAFYQCNNLSSVTIGSAVVSIGEYAFYRCYSLTSVYITDLSAWCNIYFGDSSSNPLNCGGRLYLDDNEVTDLIIPDNVTSIIHFAFTGCSSLTSITIPNSVTNIGWGAFAYCSNLTSITIPNSVRTIGDWAFYGCGLISVILPNSITTIGEETFSYCDSLVYVNIPNSVTTIGKGAFSGCSSLTSVIIPNNVTSIGGGAFCFCTSLTSVTIPNSVTSIGDRVFQGCTSLTSIAIPNSMTNIGLRAIANCPELADVYCYAENVPNTNSSAFDDSYIEYATLHVPESSLDLYRTTLPWSNFGTIVALNGEGPGTEPEVKKCATPTISYTNGTLKFGCETEGAEFVSEITDQDIKKHYEASISLTATYHISVFATKIEYENSDTIQATLCWIEQQPRTEGITDEDAVTEVPAVPVLIQTHGNSITVQGAKEGTEISLYSVNGMLLDTVISSKGDASLNASRLSSSVAIVKIGDKAVKVLIK